MSWSEVATVVVGIGTVAVGWYTYRATNKASEQAGSAVLQAKDANSLAREANTLAEGSNRIAASAVDLAKAAPTDVAWDEMLVALAAMQTLDPATGEQDFAPFLTATRTRAMLLVDRVNWEHFGTWVAWEVQLGVTLMHAALVVGESQKPLSVQRILDINEPFHTWCAGFTRNLRHVRRTGPDPEAFADLTRHAEDLLTNVTKRHGWPMPSPSIPGLSPLRP